MKRFLFIHILSVNRNSHNLCQKQDVYKRQEIKRLNDAYDELTENQQKLVKNKEVLNKATEDILAIKIANATSKMCIRDSHCSLGWL